MKHVHFEIRNYEGFMDRINFETLIALFVPCIVQQIFKNRGLSSLQIVLREFIFSAFLFKNNSAMFIQRLNIVSGLKNYSFPHV